MSGRVLIGARTPALMAATVHLYLEDVSVADAGARVVAETAIRDVRHEPSAAGSQGTIVPFELRARLGGPAIDPRADYAVRVWVDSDGDGRRGPGDLYTDEVHRVLTGGFGRRLEVRLDRESREG